MRTPLAIGLLLSAAVLGACSSGEIVVEGVGRIVIADDGSELATYELRERGRVADTTRARLFYVQGSDYESVRRVIPRLAGAAATGMTIVLMEKRGIDLEGEVDQDAVLAGATLERRIADHAAVIDDHLRRDERKIPNIVFGGSEGANVAAAVASTEARVTHLILIGGGGWSQAEEFQHMLRKDGEVCSITDAKGLELQFERIQSAPESMSIWAGHPYRRWASFLDDALVDRLVDLDIPILMVHGEADRSVPVESARAARDAFAARRKSNLTYVELPGVNHSLEHVASGRSAFPHLEIVTIRFLAACGLMTATESDRFIDRVRRAHPDAWHPEDTR